MKRRMKKLAALLLSAVMAMGVLSGCGSSGSGGTTESAAGTEAASAAEGASQDVYKRQARLRSGIRRRGAGGADGENAPASEGEQLCLHQISLAAG